MAKTDADKVLIVDDDKEVRYSLKRVLQRAGYSTEEAEDGERGLALAQSGAPAVILLDNRMGETSGMEVLQNLRSSAVGASVVMMTAYGTTQTAIEAMKFGAFDYLMKPFETDRIREVVERAVQAYHSRRESRGTGTRVRAEDYAEGLVGDSPAMQAVLKQVGQVTASDATVMITGESGTGKELVARCIHQHSLRAKKNFLAVNCAAIPDNLIESELFGHEKGSFTGATSQRQGKFELCDGGTLFLDEIGDMALPTQTKILRAIQEGEIQRVGGTTPVAVDVRLIAATNKDLEAMVREGTFREDLYYRLNVFPIRLPALRDRPEDIPLILDYHLQRLGSSGKIRARGLSDDALAILRRYEWPGNVRELENTLYRSAVVAQGELILPEDLPLEVRGGAGEAASPAASAGATAAAEDADELLDRLFASLREESAGALLERAESGLVQRAVEACGGNQSEASALLGISRSKLRSRLEPSSSRSRKSA